MTELVWQDPPPRRTDLDSYASEIEALKTNPGKWALITKTWKTTAAPAAFKQAGCEVTVRRNRGTAAKTWTVYARFPLAEPKVRADAGVARGKVQHAVSTGTALQPPAAGRPPLPALKASGGYSQFLANQRNGAAAAQAK